MGGSAMVSRNGRKENIRQTGAHADDLGRGASARRDFDRWRASRHPAHPAAGDPVGRGPEYSSGAVGILVGPGDAPTFGRPHPAASSPALGDSVTKNLFIAGTPGVGKTSLLREVTLSKRER